ncbi:MAG: DNA polymerase IV [Bacteroidales bacterium]|nr:DNA polymerase IV [Bacteroidales bacterium]
MIHNAGNERRSIVHLDLDSFFVSVERLINNRLNGKPVIVGSLSGRGVVASCSYEARKYGVHSAMPMKMARQLCADAVIVRGDMDLYSKYSNVVTDIIASEAPAYEKASVDEHYIDITGMDRFFGCLKWTKELRGKIIRETGLPVSLGLSVNKTVSKIATGEAKPNGEKEVGYAMVRDFLNPLSISKIPMLGEKTFHLLRSMGVATIGTLSLIPVGMMEKLLGKNGIMLWKKANGIDHTPVIPYQEQKSIGTERTFDTDTTDLRLLNNVLAGMVERIAYDMRREEKLASCVTVKIRYSNFDTHTLQQRIPYTSFDHKLLEVTRSLFYRLYKRRMLIRLIGVKFSHLVHGTPQLSLFEDTPEMVRLYHEIDRIRLRYGKESLFRAAGL